MTVYGRILLAGFGSATLLLAAIGFQYLGGLAPCPLCIWQRWPHLVAVAAALLATTVLWRQRRPLAVLGTGAMAAGAGLALYHVGIERDWWRGAASCSAPDPSGLTSAELLAQIMAAPPVRCDEVAWDLLGISMAGWNGIASLGLGALWAASVVWWRMPQASSSALR